MTNRRRAEQLSDAATVYLLYEKAGKKAPSPAEPFPPFLLACVLQTRREHSPAGAMSESGSASAAAAAAIPNGGSAARHPGNLVTVVLGAQWGDEGKGKVVDLLAQDADIVCRCQVSAPMGRRGCHLEAAWRGSFCWHKTKAAAAESRGTFGAFPALIAREAAERWVD